MVNLPEISRMVKSAGTAIAIGVLRCDEVSGRVQNYGGNCTFGRLG